ncbi:MAG: right-handed parallel beta-helix repeat-containing protein, partial [Alistipes sp.]|nr:right-handed parallel beta-helix repeat-containing protein [Alistipes sp.]
LVYRCKSGGFHQHYGVDNLVQNNIFGGQIRTQLEASRIEEHTSFRFLHNIICYDQGVLGGIAWNKVKFDCDYNCYWDRRTTEIQVMDTPFAAWQAAGRDTHSVIADPGFDLQHFDFTLRNPRIARKIGFKPFDYTQAGVYGSSAWQQKAVLDSTLTEAFDRRVESYENLSLTNAPMP